MQLADGRRYTPRQDQPLEYAVGRRWSTRFSVRNEKTRTGASLEFQFHISGKERVQVPAGSFDCFVIEGLATGLTDNGLRLETRSRRWLAPDLLRRPVAAETLRKIWVPRKPKPPGGEGGPGGGFGMRKGPGPGGPELIERVQESRRTELVSFKQS